MEKKVYSFEEFIKEAYTFKINEEEKSLSGLKTKTILAGASKDKTSSQAAVNKFKESVDKLEIDGNLKTDGALFKDSIKNKDAKKNLYYDKKKSKGKDYIKIGENLISGDTGKTVYIKTTIQKILDSGVEVAGNGIYAFGRLWKLWLEKKVKRNDDVVMVLNLKKPGGFIASAETGFQNLPEDFGIACLYTLLAAKAMVFNPENKFGPLVTINKAAEEDKWDMKKYLSKSATPSLSRAGMEKEEYEKLRDKIQEKGDIDISKTLEDIKNKKSKSEKELFNMVEKIVKNHLTEFIKISAERFKEFLNISASNAGVPEDSFENMKKIIDDWQSNEVKNTSSYTDKAKNMVTYALSKLGEGGPAGSKGGAIAGSEEIKKKIGEF